ncbi:MAG: hypothetical protein WC335_02675 [Candidatus Omnitrophota bacterium]|jgi:hypothetical protein
MKNTMLKTVIMLMVALSFACMVKAEEFQVSCVMPAIPGLNAPLIQEENVVSPQSSPAETQSLSNQENNPDENSSPLIQQEDSTKKVFLAQNNTPVMVQTLYSR